MGKDKSLYLLESKSLRVRMKSVQKTVRLVFTISVFVSTIEHTFSARRYLTVHSELRSC